MLEKILTGSIVVLDLHPDGTLRAANIDKTYNVVDDGAVLSTTNVREVVTAEGLAGVLPAHGVLLVRVSSLEADLAAAAQDLGAVTAARDALQAQIDAAAAQARSAVTPVQARLALKQAGLLTAVTAYIASLPDDDEARIIWDFALMWRRESPFIAGIGAQFGLTSEQIDNLFALAATL